MDGPLSQGLRRVLLPARGAAAVRLARSVVDAGLEAVVLLDAHDEQASWIDRAGGQAAHVGPGPAGWPDPDAVVGAALDAGCDAVLPGWDHLARDVELARACGRSGLAWLGWDLDLLELAADRVRVRHLGEELGLPVVPGTDRVEDAAEALAWASNVGFPVAVKPARGRSRPLVRADDATELAVVAQGQLEGGRILVERYVLGAREIEVPLAGDGEEVVVSLGTRELTGRITGSRRLCSAPAALPEDLADRAEDLALDLAATIGWRGVGAVQLLLTPDDRLYLLDLRPGLSPHDGVTERIYGVDLVDAALRTGMGQPLLWAPETVLPDGFGLDLRLVATGTAGQEYRLAGLRLPREAEVVIAPGDRVRTGDELGHVLVHGQARHPVLVRAKVAAEALELQGVPCALPALRRLLGSDEWWHAPLGREQATALLGVDPER